MEQPGNEYKDKDNMPSKHEEQINRYLEHMKNERMDAYSSELTIRSSQSIVVGGIIARFQEVAERSLKDIAEGCWQIQKDFLDIDNLQEAYRNIDNGSVLNDLATYIESQVEVIPNEILSREHTLKGEQKDTILNRLKGSFQNQGTLLKQSYERELLKYKAQLSRAMREKELSDAIHDATKSQAESTKEQVKISKIMTVITLLSIGIAAVNIWYVHETTRLTRETTQLAKESVKTSSNSLQLLQKQWSYYLSPNIIVDYYVKHRDESNYWLYIYLKNYSNVACEITSVKSNWGNISNQDIILSPNQDYSIPMGNIRNQIKEGKNPFTVDVEYKNGKETANIKRSFTINMNKEKSKDMSDLYYTFESLEKSFNIYDKPNLSSCLYDIRASMDKIAKALEKK